MIRTMAMLGKKREDKRKKNERTTQSGIVAADWRSMAFEPASYSDTNYNNSHAIYRFCDGGSTRSKCFCCDRSGSNNYLVVWRNYLCDSSGIFRTGRTSYWREKRERSQTGGMPWSAGCTSGIRNFVCDRTYHQRKTAGVAGR